MSDPLLQRCPGLQHHTIAAAAPYGLPLHHSTLASYLAHLHYTPHSVGKWHLGFHQALSAPCSDNVSHFLILGHLKDCQALLTDGEPGSLHAHQAGLSVAHRVLGGHAGLL